MVETEKEAERHAEDKRLRLKGLEDALARQQRFVELIRTERGK